MPISGRQLETGEIVVKISKTTCKRVRLALIPSPLIQVLNASFEVCTESKNLEKDVGPLPSDNYSGLNFRRQRGGVFFSVHHGIQLYQSSTHWPLCHFY